VIAEGQLWAKQQCIEPLYMQGFNPTEPANYTSSYTTVMKRIVDTEIIMQQSSRIILITAEEMLSLLKLTVSEEQEKGGLRT